MVLPFTPPLGNATHPCSYLEEYNAGRPPVPSPGFIYPAMVGALVMWALTLYAAYGIVHYRDHPRFAKVRPMSLSFLTLASINLYMLAGIIGVPAQLPCAASMVFYPVSVSGMFLAIALRGMTLSLEHQFATLAQNLKGVIGGAGGSEYDEVASVTLTTITHALDWRSDAAGIALLFKVAFGSAKIEAMELSQVVLSKRVFSWFMVAILLPGVMTSIIMILALPQVRGECSLQCTEVFVEQFIALIVLMSVYCFIVAKCLLVAFANVGWDDKGVLFELVLLPTTVTTAVGLGWIIVLVDPNDIAYRREFNWHWLFYPPGLWYWWISFGYQFYKASASTNAQNNSTGFVIPDMVKACDADPDLKREFAVFAAQQYSSELLLFLEDCRAYKRMFFDKAENWRVSKAKLLVKTYIEPGANLEINISYECKQRILDRYLQARSTNDRLFDEAVHEIENVLQHGVWTYFMSKRKRADTATKGRAMVANSSAFIITDSGTPKASRV